MNRCWSKCHFCEILKGPSVSQRWSHSQLSYGGPHCKENISLSCPSQRFWLASEFDTYMKLDVNLRVRRVWFVWITTIFAYPTILQYEKLVDLWPASPGSVFVGNMFTKTEQKMVSLMGTLNYLTSRSHFNIIFFIDDAFTNLQLLPETMKRHVLERPIPVVVVILRFVQISASQSAQR